MPRKHFIPNRDDWWFRSAISPYPRRFQHPLSVQHREVGHVSPHGCHALPLGLVDRPPLRPFVCEPRTDEQAQGSVSGRRIEDRRLYAMELELFERPAEHELYSFAGIAAVLHVGFRDDADVGFARWEVGRTGMQVDESSFSTFGRGRRWHSG